jgi:hypothetical protein
MMSAQLTPKRGFKSKLKNLHFFPPLPEEIRAEHEAYVTGLESVGLDITVLP